MSSEVRELGNPTIGTSWGTELLRARVLPLILDAHSAVVRSRPMSKAMGMGMGRRRDEAVNPI
jgi:hypothetical protein